MKITELQDKDAYENDTLWQKFLADKNTEWNNKKINEAEYHSRLACCYCNMFKPAECKHHAALVPEWAHAQEKGNALAAVARVLVYENKIEEALTYYKQTHVLEPAHEVAIEEAGWCCYQLTRYNEAEEWFTIGTRLHDENEVMWEGLGLSLAQQNKYEEAITAFKKALAMCNMEHSGYYYHHLLGQCYAGLNNFYIALAYYTKTLEARPTYAHALTDIAALYYNQEGDMVSAIDYLKKAEAIATTDNDEEILQLVYINQARLYDKMKEFALHEHYTQKLLTLLGFGGLADSDGE